MAKEGIITYAGDIENYIKEKIVDYFDRNNNGCMSGLQHYVRQLENRSKEYHTPSFVVLVVGPVKSGKSTFVNLIAKNYVSPTHFLECTVRPSIISKKQDEAFLEVYKSCKLEDKSEQMKDILDFLNGLIEKHEINNVEIVRYGLSRESIDKYVKRNLIEVQNDEILLTAIQTEGGKLLQDNVLLVDMAGFDGANVNFESPAYKEIVERADLIVFVQSSNSAISKVSTDFFSLLKDRNSSVPVCLIHNVFESAYWRSDKLNFEKVEEQKEYAKEVIRERHGLILEDGYAFNVNLGMVNDRRDNNYEDIYKEVLNREAIEFEKVEEEIYKLFAKRERIRLKNCITRTKLYQNKLLEAIKNLLEEQKTLLEKYINIGNAFESPNNFVDEMPFTRSIPIELNDLKQKVYEAFRYIQQTNTLGRSRGVVIQVSKESVINVGGFTTVKARSIVDDFFCESQKRINEYLNSELQKLYSVINEQEFQNFLTLLNSKLIYKESENDTEEFNLGFVATKDINFEIEDKVITYEHGASATKMVPQLPGFNRHSTDDVNQYLEACKIILLGEKDESIGYVENYIFPEINKIINKTIEGVKSSIKSSLQRKIDEIKIASLKRIILDIEDFKENNKKLEIFNNKVNKLIINDLANE